MKIKLLVPLAMVATLALPLAAQAQGTVRGAEEGAAAGGNAAGPLGAIVGGAVGAATGTAGAILGVDDRPRFREYVVRERRPSYAYREPLRAGVVLPEAGVTYYDVPAEYHARPGYRYTIVNGHPVLVEARTRRVVEVID
jgi:hypothetical protein